MRTLKRRNEPVGRSRRARWVPALAVVPLLAAALAACSGQPGGFGQTYTIFDNRAPKAAVSDADTKAVELGVRFRSSVRGLVTGVRFFKTEGNTGTHTGSLWSTSGERLATGTFTDESGSGWQEMTFDEPVLVEPGTNYVASYHAPNGRYVAEPFGLVSSTVNGPLTALAHGAGGPNPVYRYGALSTFPTDTWLSANYWVDVRLVALGNVPGSTATSRPGSSSTSTTGSPSTTGTTTPATTPTAPADGGGIVPGAGVTLRPVDGGLGYYGRWANSLPTDEGFYPISVFNETLSNTGDTAKYKALGVNGFVGLWNGMSPQIAAALKANGQWAMTAPDRDGAPGFGREFAGYQWFDEADGRNVCGDVGWLSSLCNGSDRTPPSAIKAMADAIRAADSTRPTYGQYTKPVALGHGLDQATRKAYIDAVDIVSYDYYPISDPWDSGSLWNQADAVNSVRDLAGRNKPVWVFIETSRLFGEDPVGRAKPTDAQIQAQVWHAIIGGARGIEYFNHNFSGDPTYTQKLLIDPNYASTAAAVGKTNSQIHALAPVINAPYADGALTVQSGQVNAAIKFYKGSYYLFVGSRSKGAQTVTMKINGVGNAPVTVLHENRTTNVSNGILTDSFSGETAVHIYKIG
jgi:hypothetical protein